MQNHDDQNVTIYAGFFVRLAAYFLDAILVGTVLFFLRIPIWIVSMFNPNNMFLKPIIFFFNPCDILLYILGVLYFIIMTYNAGATIGKRLMNLKVVPVEEEKLSLITVVYRETIGKYLSSIIMCIGYILIGVDKEKRGLHDILCDTRVIYICKMKLVYPPMNMYGNYATTTMSGYMPNNLQSPSAGQPEEQPNEDTKENSNYNSF